MLIKKCRVTIPVVHVKHRVYLVGISKVHLEHKYNQINVRIGGGAERFDLYCSKNHRKFTRQLVQYMWVSQSSLEAVIEKLIRGERIRKTLITRPLFPSDDYRP